MSLFVLDQSAFADYPAWIRKHRLHRRHHFFILKDGWKNVSVTCCTCMETYLLVCEPVHAIRTTPETKGV